ncbi:hypothetical protein B0H13DRAFT_1889501 [Mycena leptocephala]|nr:hypothetical protein B0H13DRAFT_1889501 [Mycena leptocephala]
MVSLRLASSKSVPSSSTVTPPAGEASTDSQTTAKEVKSTKHVPGSADTAWNLFGREYCDAQKKLNKRPTTVEVREAFGALSSEQKKVYEHQAKNLKIEGKKKAP